MILEVCHNLSDFMIDDSLHMNLGSLEEPEEVHLAAGFVPSFFV